MRRSDFMSTCRSQDPQYTSKVVIKCYILASAPCDPGGLVQHFDIDNLEEGMAHKFKIVSRKNDQFGVQFVYNSEIMVWSESYKSKTSANHCVDSIKAHAPSASVVDLSKEEKGSGYRFEIVESKNGQFFVRFVASNGETMVISETYTDKRNAINCAQSVAKHAVDAPTEDDA